MATKECLGCGPKEENEFAADKSRADGKCPYCKACRAKQEKERRKERAALPTRICYRCGLEKLKTEFSPKERRYSRSLLCLDCQQLAGDKAYPLHLAACKRTYDKRKTKISQQKKDKRIEFKLELIQLGGGKCLDCGLESNEENPPACFDFHHKDPKEKKFSVGRALGHHANKDLSLEEIKKCDLVCATCHRRRHVNLSCTKVDEQ
jgi:hypothetical protein